MTELRAKLTSIWEGDVLWERPMAEYSTIRVGGPAAALVEPASLAELLRLVRGLRQHGLPWLVVGGGSNILVADQGFAGVVVLLGRALATISGPVAAGDGQLVTVEAGCSLAKLVAWGAERGLSGLEFAAGIPGSVGGAVVMNAGAWGGEMAERIVAVTVIDRQGESADLAREAIPFGYRSWGLGDHIVASATLAFTRGERQAIEATCRELARRRRETQPLGLPSAGSFFKNPPGLAAGRLIEQANLKGQRIGGAMVSEKHANFLVNVGGATARDFLDLMRLVQERGAQAYGVQLEPEGRIIGVPE